MPGPPRPARGPPPEGCNPWLGSAGVSGPDDLTTYPRHDRKGAVKPMKLSKTLRTVIAIGLTAAVFAAGAVAINAGATGTNTVYYACLKSGALTKVGATSPTCASGYTKISWNSSGPAGPAGARGAKGAQGATGPAGPVGPSGTAGIFGTNINSSFQGQGSGAQCTLGDVILTASVEVATNWMAAKGQTLMIGSNNALYSLLGTNYGGNGSTTFDLPNLTAAAPD